MKRTISLLLAALMLSLSLSACAQSDAPDSPDTTAPAGIDTAETLPAETTTPAETAPADPLPADLRFEGEKIRFLSQDRDWVDDEISVAELNGEVVNDAVYQRKQTVEERLGIEILNVQMGGNKQAAIPDYIQKMVLSQTDEYDIVANATYTLIEKVTENVYRNLYELPHLNLENPWWAQYYNEQVSIGNAQYLCAGDATLSLKRFAFVTLFNQEVFKRYEIGDMYQVVRDGKWTIDYQIQLASNMYEDLNGNNTRDEDDFYGFVSNANKISVDAYWASCQLPIFHKTADNTYEFKLNAERMVAAVEDINRLFWETTGTRNIPHISGDKEQDEIAKAFGNGGAAMVTLRLLNAENTEIRNMSDRYGVLPIPKLDEAQETYFTHAHDQFCSLVVPTTVPEERLAAVGATLEYFAYQSRLIVSPAYYEIALKTKYVDDPESGEMLDLIFQNVNIDAGILYYNSIQKFHSVMRTMIESNSSNVASMIKTYDRVVPKLLDRLQNKILSNQT